MPGTVNLASLASLSSVEAVWQSAGDRIAEASFDFLDAMLSRKTIVDALHIRALPGVSSSDSATIFEREFGCFLEQL